MHIDGSGFSYVALALIPGKTGAGLNFAIVPVTKLVEASYDGLSNTLRFPSAAYGFNLGERSTILHECTHALIDARKASVNWLVNEACAFIAEAIYTLASVRRITGDSNGEVAASDSISVEAQKIAHNVLAEQTEGGGAVTLTASDTISLKSSIMFTPTYIANLKNMAMSPGNDGIPLHK